MASPSVFLCFYCSHAAATSEELKNGWRISDGSFAQLCAVCVSIYEKGKFCETFHSANEGWRNCGTCQNRVHCGCVVSFDTYFLTDDCGIICKECTTRELLEERKRIRSIFFKTEIHKIDKK